MTPYGPIPAFALVAWIPFAALVFTVWRPERAALFVVVGGVLFLPQLAEFDFPAIPPLGKMEISALCALVGLLYRSPGRFSRSPPFRGVEVLVVVLMLAAFGTAQGNTEGLVYGSWIQARLPALTTRDAVSMAIRDLLRVGLPFYLGRLLFRRSRDLRYLLTFIATAGLVYSAFILIEVRMSPQFHRWVYGYGQHLDFLQTLRWGGYRPMVFMAHGLAVGLFMTITLIAAAALARARRPIWFLPPRVALAYLAVILVLCKSLGALVYALALVPLVLFTRVKTQMRAAVVLSVVVLLYPMLRTFDWFPTQKLVDIAISVNPDRAASLKFRFDNEDALSKKANEKMIFGWGGYGRRSIYDAEMGKEISIGDGHWIIQLGQRGLAGFIPVFGLLLWPVFVVRRRIRRVPDPKDRLLLSGLTLIVVVSTVDLLPNGLFSNLPFFFAGALWGLTHAMSRGATLRPEGR